MAQQVTFQQAWQAAKQGNVNVYATLGYMYLMGEGTSKNTSEALKWLQKAADAGDAYGYSLLGWMYYTGTGVGSDYNQAFKYYKIAAEKGNVAAYYRLGYLYRTGKGTVKNYPKAFKWTKLAVENGLTQAYVHLAQMYFNGIGTVQNDSEGFRLLKLAADNGDTNSYNALGYCYQTGTGTTKDLSEGYKWYKLAAENGDVSSYLNLSACYYNGLGVSKNETQAFQWTKKAAENDNVQAYLLLASLYFGGQGVEKDSVEGFNWIKKAADKEYPPSYSVLGDYYSRYKKDYEKAIYWFKRGTEAGDPESFVNMGLMYVDGIGVEQSDIESYKCFKTAAEKGYAMGYNNLANSYLLGRGVKADLKEALKLANKSLEIEVSPLTLDTKGEVCYLMGDIKQARECYQRILREYPDFYDNLERYSVNGEDKEKTRLQMYLTQSDVDTDIPNTSVTNDKTFAVIVANEMYKRESRVPFAANDGNVFAKYCKGLLGLPEANVHVVINGTLNDLKHEISWLTKILNAYGGEAKGIFYYAGHGIPDEATRNAYLLPADGYGNDINTGYSLSQLYKDLGSAQSQCIAVFLDACFSGAKREGGMMASTRGIALKANEGIPEGNMVVFSAAYGDETANSFSKMGHGMFTYYLLKELKETKGEATFKQLGDYVTKEVGRQSILINNKSQTPTVIPSESVTGKWENWKLK